MCALVHQPASLTSNMATSLSSSMATLDEQYSSAGPSIIRANANPPTNTTSSRQQHRLQELPCPLLIPETTPIHKMPRGIMSLSLGKDAHHHSWVSKAKATRMAGHQGIEVHIEDVENTARIISNLDSTAKPSPQQLYSAAALVRRVCDGEGLTIICLEPFLHYPGILPLSKRDQRLREELPVWFTMTDILGTDVIQIASAMFGGEGVATDDEERIVEDLRLLAELALAWRDTTTTATRKAGQIRPKFWAYEAMCFGAYTTTWEQAWRQVQLVDRPNFGLVIDTFQIAGAYYADPSSLDGKMPNADVELEGTLQRLYSTFGGDSEQARLNRHKVFFVQLGDAAKMDPPLSASHPLFDANVHANLKMAWARTNRRFQSEGYMPCNRVAQVFIEKCGWRGWLSAEYFNLDLVNEDDAYPLEAAERCMKGHQSFLKTVGAAPPPAAL